MTGGWKGKRNHAMTGKREVREVESVNFFRFVFIFLRKFIGPTSLTSRQIRNPSRSGV